MQKSALSFFMKLFLRTNKIQVSYALELEELFEEEALKLAELYSLQNNLDKRKTLLEA